VCVCVWVCVCVCVCDRCVCACWEDSFISLTVGVDSVQYAVLQGVALS